MGVSNYGDLSRADITVTSVGTINLKGKYNTIVTVKEKATLNLSDLLSNIEIIAKAKGATIVVPADAGGIATITAEADDVLVKYDDKNLVDLISDGGSFKHQMVSSTDEPADKAEPVPGAAETWIGTLHVIDDAEYNGLTEIITPSAASGSSVTFTSGGKTIEENLVGKKNEGETLEITGVSISVSGSYLSYNSATKAVTCKIPGNIAVTNEISIKISVKEKESGDIKTITKKIKVNITK